MQSATNEIRQITEQGRELLRKAELGQVFLPRGVQAKVCASMLTLNSALNVCVDHERNIAAKATQPGGIDRSLPAGDR